MHMSFHSDGLSEKLLERAFPFHLVVSVTGEIISCGEPIARKIGFKKSANIDLFEHFTIKHPRGINCTDQLVGKEKKIFLLAAKHNSDLLLRGQLVTDNDKNNFIFLISPWVTDIKVLDTLGLTVRDFPVHSLLSDFLILVQAQKVSLADSMRLSDELTRLNKELEDRVARRTSDLVLKAEELLESKNILEYEMSERQRVEIELRHAHKLESVGQLAAGIAHEINTPMQYIGSNLSFLKDSFKDLDMVNKQLAQYLSQEKVGSDANALELQQLLEEADLSYVCEAGPQALDMAIQGINRVTQIVGAMNEFTHPDNTEMDSANINRALDTILVVASSEYKYVATIECNYGDLPNVNCFLGDLKQVFLNLIVNASHAISDNKVANGVIKISTKQENEFVVVSISDNGTGIPEELQHRIFDHFITTKEVGKGTGQGLSISHRIVVEKHGGRLTFDTVKGEGTTFHIALPLSARISRESANCSDDKRDVAA
jgi:signal transduction histidine kinase